MIGKKARRTDRFTVLPRPLQGLAAHVRMTGGGVPAEYFGAARAFWEHMRRDDLAATIAINEITAPLRRRFRNNPTPHPQLIAQAARAWPRRLPAAGRMDFAVKATGKRLRIDELRIGAADLGLPQWNGRELGVTLIAVRLVVDAHQSALTMIPVAYVSLHAIARWHQRALDTSRAALLADLHQIARWSAEPAADTTNDFAIAVANGQWMGAVRDWPQDGLATRTLDVRTFLGTDALTRVQKQPDPLRDPILAYPDTIFEPDWHASDTLKPNKAVRSPYLP